MSTSTPRRAVSFAAADTPTTANAPQAAGVPVQPADANASTSARDVGGYLEVEARANAADTGMFKFAALVDQLTAQESELRAKLTNVWAVATMNFFAGTLLPMANGAIRGLVRESHNARRDCADATSALAQRDAEVSGLLIHEQSVRGDRESLQVKLEASERRAREHELLSAASQEQAKALRDELRGADRQLLELKERCSSLEASTANRKDEAVDAIRQADDLRSELRDRKARVMQLENELYSANSMLSDLRARLTLSEEKVKQLRDRNLALIDELESVARDVAAVQQEASENAAAARSDSAQTTPTRHRRLSLAPSARAPIQQQQSGSPNAAAYAVASVRERMDAVIEAKNAEIAALLKQKSNDDERIRKLDNELHHVKEMHRSAASLAASIRDALTSNELVLTSTQNDLRAAQEERTRLIEQNASVSSQLKDANRLINELTENNRNLQREASMWERRVREGETEGNRAEGKLAAMSNDLEMRARLIAHLETRNEALTNDLETSQKKLALTTEALRETSEVIGPLRDELSKNSKIIVALKEKFQLNAERHNATGASSHSHGAAAVVTPARTGHYRVAEADQDDAAEREVATFLESTQGSIVERLQDVIFAKTDEIKRLTHTKNSLMKQLQDAEVSIERLVRDAQDKSDEYRRSLSQALNTFTGIGGYDSLVEGVFRAKELHFKVDSLRTELDFSEKRGQHLLVRVRVLERHLEDSLAGKAMAEEQLDGVGGHQRPASEIFSDFASKLDAVLDASVMHEAQQAAAGAGDTLGGSPVLSLDGSPTRRGVSPNSSAMARNEPPRDTVVRAVATRSTTRGLLFRASESPTRPRAAAAAPVAAPIAHLTDHRPKSDRILALEAKMAHVDSLRRQLLDLESAAANTENGASRQRIFDEMNRLHQAGSSASSTPRPGSPSTGTRTPTMLTPRSGYMEAAAAPTLRLEEVRDGLRMRHGSSAPRGGGQGATPQQPGVLRRR